MKRYEAARTERQALGTRPNQALVFLTHHGSRRIYRHFERLRHDLRDVMPAYLALHRPEEGTAEPLFVPDLTISAADAASAFPIRYDAMIRQRGDFFHFNDLVYPAGVYACHVQRIRLPLDDRGGRRLFRRLGRALRRHGREPGRSDRRKLCAPVAKRCVGASVYVRKPRVGFPRDRDAGLFPARSLLARLPRNIRKGGERPCLGWPFRGALSDHCRPSWAQDRDTDAGRARLRRAVLEGEPHTRRVGRRRHLHLQFRSEPQRRVLPRGTGELSSEEPPLPSGEGRARCLSTL